ncbi:hypothetical protein HYX13_04595 [Candidatus Woesearchaeota archaeon]|nr:hypothetical protein [Candidatus Woesearchaeota archaeon]
MKKSVKEVQKKDEQKNLPYATFWASMGIVFLVSFLVMLSSLENSVTGHATIQNIATAKAGSALTLEVKTIPGVKEAIVFFKEEVKNSQISFTEDKNIPFSGIFYVKFTVSSPDQEKIGQVDFTFKIQEQDLKKANINFNDLSLFVNKKEISTVLVKKENEYYYYSASTQELGAMVLGQTQHQQTASSVTTAPSILAEELPSLTPSGTEVLPEIETSQEAVSGKAAGQEEIGAEENINVSIWQKIKMFFRNLFS